LSPYIYCYFCPSFYSEAIYVLKRNKANPMKKITLWSLAFSLLAFTPLSAQEDADNQPEEKEKKESNIKYRSWSVGLNVGANYLLGDHYAYETGKADVFDDFGGAGLDISLNLNKWINSAYGISFDFGYGRYSGTRSYDRPQAPSPEQIYFAFDAEAAYRASVNFMVNLNGFGARNKTGNRRDAWIIFTGIGFNTATANLYREGSVSNQWELGANDLNVFFNSERSISGHRSYFIPIALEWHYKLNDRLDLKLGVRGTWLLDDNADGSNTAIASLNNIPAHQLDQMYPNATSDWIVNFNVGANYYFGMRTPKMTEPIVYIDAMTEIERRVAKNENNLDKLMKDEDGDGVSDFFDKDPKTPAGYVVDGSGVALDIDGDGVPDSIDEDPFSTPGAVVDAKGREIDSDGDGVPDSQDLEPNTPPGTLVNFQGVTIPSGAFGGADGADAASIYIPSIFFATDRADITAANKQRILTVARLMMSNPNIRIRVVGNTDVRASEKYNDKLGERRAKAAVKELSRNFGIDESRFEIVSKGKLSPISKEHMPNRRVDFEIIAN
jgi:outer membrane protein OmpA-like peptidoglycan-associated protein